MEWKLSLNPKILALEAAIKLAQRRMSLPLFIA